MFGDEGPPMTARLSVHSAKDVRSSTAPTVALQAGPHSGTCHRAAADRVAIGFTVVRPERGPQVVDAFCRRSARESFVVQVRHLSRPFEPVHDGEAAGRIDSQNGRAAGAGIVTHRPKVVQISIELKIHDPGQRASNRRDAGKAVGRVIECVGVSHSIRLDSEQTSGPWLRVLHGP